jgi:hypothetical protein
MTAVDGFGKALLADSACAESPLQDGMKVKDLVSLVSFGYPLICVKEGNEYCAVKELTMIEPLIKDAKPNELEGRLVGLFSGNNTEIICSTCAKKQLELAMASNVTLGTLDIKTIGTAISQICATKTTTTTPKPTQTSSAMAMKNAVSVMVYLAVLFI